MTNGELILRFGWGIIAAGVLMTAVGMNRFEQQLLAVVDKKDAQRSSRKTYLKSLIQIRIDTSGFSPKIAVMLGKASMLMRRGAIVIYVGFLLVVLGGALISKVLG